MLRGLYDWTLSLAARKSAEWWLAFIAFVESLLGYNILSPDVYYISNIPSDLRWDDVTVIGITAFVLSLLSTLYPSWRAAQTRPAEALRYD